MKPPRKIEYLMSSNGLKARLDEAERFFMERTVSHPVSDGHYWETFYNLMINESTGTGVIKIEEVWDNFDTDWGEHIQEYHIVPQDILSVFKALKAGKAANISCQGVHVRSERYHIIEHLKDEFKETVQTGKIKAELVIKDCQINIKSLGFSHRGEKHYWSDESIDSKGHPDDIRRIITDSLGLAYRLSSSSLFDEFVRKMHLSHALTEQDINFIYRELQRRDLTSTRNISSIIPSILGYTSKSGFTFRDIFIKVDAASRLLHEYYCYMLDLGEFNNFRPDDKRVELIVDEKDMGILWIDNLVKYTPGPIKARRMYGDTLGQELDSRWNKLTYNLFLMGVFHKGAKRHSPDFDDVVYRGVHGLSHLQENKEAFKNTSGIGYQRFLETSIDEDAAAAIVLHHNERKRLYADSVIHGDWKPENMVNGHMVDYAMVGRGFEVDELAYYLSDSRFNTDLTAFHHHIDMYIRLRSTHDPEFAVRVKEGYARQMHKLADSAYLSQLVLHHSVMNKRDMLDDEKFRQRQYYQHRIDDVLKNGRFV